jgi:hypothetical protein
MNTNILTDISRNLLWAWWLDVKFLIDTIEEHKLDFDDIYENVEMNFWEDFTNNINYFIYEVLNQIANKFIETHSKLFEDKSNEEFEIYTNYMDSSICFTDEKVQSEFERFC